jgi:alkanesulfonate monooxygenase SsuD/methylene tetrahydromethanopterin reductase-like flavin-dependent oxidoreductase (luciferase family)
MSGRNQIHPSPQRTPVLFQAGTSKSGSAFAAKHAEAIFLNTATVAQAAKTIKEARAAAEANGRDPKSLKFFPCIVPIIGKTIEEAKAKRAFAEANADIIAGLGQFSGYTGLDMSKFPLDEPFELSTVPGQAMIQSVLKAFESGKENSEPWTPRRLGLRMALGGLHPCPVGTPEMIADVFEEWINIADCDGFNIAYVSNPGSYEDVVDLLCPVLMKRGLMWEDYDVPQGTFRENLFGVKGQTKLRDDHYGSTFKWEKEIESESTPQIEVKA